MKTFKNRFKKFCFDKLKKNKPNNNSKLPLHGYTDIDDLTLKKGCGIEILIILLYPEKNKFEIDGEHFEQLKCHDTTVSQIDIEIIIN